MAASSPAAADQNTKSKNMYEGMFVLDSSRFASDPEASEKAVLEILNKAGADVVANRPWMDGKLAYEIEGQRKGLHYLTYFRMEGSGVTEITRLSKLSDLVLRHMLIKHPESLFEAMVSAVLGGDSSSAEDEEEKAKETEDAAKDVKATDEDDADDATDTDKDDDE